MSSNDQNINEALLWRYFEDDLSSEEKTAIEKWKAESADNLKLFDDTKKLFQLTQVKVEENTFDANAAWQKIQPKLKVEESNNESTPVVSINKKKSSYTSLWWAAAAFIGIILSVNVVNRLIEPDWVMITAENTIQEVFLADGSMVALKPGASLKYLENFNKKDRVVYLEGDAFFDVERNEQLPFSIQGEDVQVTVLGTEFLVKQSDEGNAEVIVQEGKVAVDSKKEEGEPDKKEGESIVLEAGEKGIFKRAEQKLIKEINKDPNYLAWKTKVLQFDKANLQEVIKKIEEVYQVKITLSKNEIQQCSLTARFDNQSIEEIMQTLSLTLNLQIEKDGKVYTLDGAGC